MVQRVKVAFVREIWLPIRETGRFVLYPGELACMHFQPRYSYKVYSYLKKRVCTLFYNNNYDFNPWSSTLYSLAVSSTS